MSTHPRVLRAHLFLQWRNQEFDLGGVNHPALVCPDMKRTVEFYTQVLGMRLIKTIDLPAGSGQHFLFDMGGGTRWPSSGSPTRPHEPGLRLCRAWPTIMATSGHIDPW